jgi:D-alanyl-D-alanine carboxypeptidase
MTQYVFAPAGLQNTSYCLPVPANLARTYSLPNEVLEPLHLNVSAVFAAGGICSTAGDLLQWMDALTTGKVISVESYQQMITPIMLSDGSIGTVGYGLYTIQDTSYGLQVGFYGMEASFDAYLISYPERGLTIVWLTNTAQPDNRILDGIFTNIPILMP